MKSYILIDTHPTRAKETQPLILALQIEGVEWLTVDVVAGDYWTIVALVDIERKEQLKELVIPLIKKLEGVTKATALPISK